MVSKGVHAWGSLILTKGSLAVVFEGLFIDHASFWHRKRVN